MVHALRWRSGARVSVLEHETDRARFLGRGRDAASPRALASSDPLSGTTGNVLDPAFSLRQALRRPGETVTAELLLGVAGSREQALMLVESRVSAKRSRARAGARARGVARDRDHRGTGRAPSALAGAVLRGDPAVRASREMLARATAIPHRCRVTVSMGARWSCSMRAVRTSLDRCSRR